MEVLKFATVMLPLLAMANAISIETLDDKMIYPTEPHQKITKRDAPSTLPVTGLEQRKFYQFVEEKLIQHSQALEHLIRITTDAVSALSGLAENISRNVEQPKLPEKVEADNVEERTGDEEESRRSYWGNHWQGNSLSQIKTSPSPWCSVAILCHRTRSPVCGYDDRFGYGKFDDLCHMLQVNCYWKYNFALVPNCRSTLY